MNSFALVMSLILMGGTFSTGFATPVGQSGTKVIGTGNRRQFSNIDGIYFDTIYVWYYSCYIVKFRQVYLKIKQMLLSENRSKVVLTTLIFHATSSLEFF